MKPDLSLPGHPSVFAIGDIVDCTDANGVKVPGVSPGAIQMGQHVAKVIETAENHLDRGETDMADHLRPKFVYWDKGMMATIGRSAAVAAAGKLRMKGFIAWLAWLFVHIIFLVGFRNRVIVLTPVALQLHELQAWCPHRHRNGRAHRETPRAEVDCAGFRALVLYQPAHLTFARPRRLMV